MSILSEKQIKALKSLQEAFTKKSLFVDVMTEDEKNYIHRLVVVSMVGASTRIENALLTDIEVEWIDTVLTENGKPSAFRSNKDIIFNKLSKDRERSIEEVAGCREMLNIIYEQAKDFVPLTETHLKGLHQVLLQHYPKARTYAGNYKTITNSVIEKDSRTGQQRTVFKTAEPGPITESAMHDLMLWYNERKNSDPWPIRLATEFVYRFLAIHPFQDGNGRLGRALFILVLLQSDDRVVRELAPFLAIDRHIEKFKSEYYYALNKCSNGVFRQNSDKYRMEYFLDFMVKVLIDSLDTIEKLLNKKRALVLLSESTLKILDCFKGYPELRLTMKHLMLETDLPRRTINYALNQLIENHFIQKYGQGAGTRYQLCF